MPRVSDQTSCAQPKVSVPMITYNHEKFVAQAIESVLMQETDFPVELVIGEDCSTDSTRKIVQEYAARYPNAIRALLPEHNLGMMPNAIATLTACRGEYLALLEGDDYWTHAAKLKKQVAAMESHPDWALCFHRVRFVSNETGETAGFMPPGPQRQVSTVEDLLITSPMHTCSILCRNGLVNPWPDWMLGLAMGDYPLQVLTALHGKIGFMDEVMADYRMHEGGVWANRGSAWQTCKYSEMLSVLRTHLPRSCQRILLPIEAKYYFSASIQYYCENQYALARRLAWKPILRHFLKPGFPRRDGLRTLYTLYFTDRLRTRIGRIRRRLFAAQQHTLSKPPC